MNKLMLSSLPVLFIVSNAFASDRVVSKQAVGGTIITVNAMQVIKPIPAKMTKKAVRGLFEYGLDEKGLSKSQREYREFLAAGTFSKLRTLSNGAYRNMGSGGGGYSGRSGGKAIHGKPYNVARSSGSFASLNQRRGRFGSSGFATLTTRRR